MREVDHNTAVRQILRFLKGPVADVFRQLIPQFGEINGEDFYEMVLSSSDMLHGCVAIFHKHRDAFEHLIIDAQGRVVHDDFVQLKCGRSVHDVIAMILRTHAKKQFRAQLGGDPGDPKSKAGRLYSAIKEYLIHDWQIALVPHYAELPVEMVEKMGPQLFKFTSVEEVQALTGPVTADDGEDLALLDAAGPSNRDPDYWWETLNDSLVRSLLSPISDAEIRELTAAFCMVSEGSHTALLAQFKLSLQQAAVVLAICYRTMGRSSFNQSFCGDSISAAQTLSEKLASSGLSARQDLPDIARMVEKVVRSSGRLGGRSAGAA